MSGTATIRRSLFPDEFPDNPAGESREDSRNQREAIQEAGKPIPAVQATGKPENEKREAGKPSRKPNGKPREKPPTVQAKPTPATATATPAGGAQSIRVLSVRQPWCDGLLEGWKPVENRGWNTTYRGRLYLHASKLEPCPDHAAIAKLHKCEDMADEVCKLWTLPGSRQTGAILGSVDLVDIVPMDLPESIESHVIFQEQTLAQALPELREEFPDISEERIKRVWKLMAHLEGEKLWSLWQGPFCWIVEKPKRMKRPIETGGKLNLWTFTAKPGELE